MFCSNCGNEIDNNVNICGKCGCKVNKNNTTDSSYKVNQKSETNNLSTIKLFSNEISDASKKVLIYKILVLISMTLGGLFPFLDTISFEFNTFHDQSITESLHVLKNLTDIIFSFVNIMYVLIYGLMVLMYVFGFLFLVKLLTNFSSEAIDFATKYNKVFIIMVCVWFCLQFYLNRINYYHLFVNLKGWAIIIVMLINTFIFKNKFNDAVYHERDIYMSSED